MSNARNLASFLGTSTTVPYSNLPTGSVLQLVQGTTQTQVSMTTTYADMGLSVNITPKTSDSDIFILVNSQIYIADLGFGTRLLRGSTVICIPASTDTNGPFEGYISSGGHLRTGFNFLDTGRSSGTSQITYKLQGRKYNASASIAYNYNDATANDAISLIQAIEIAV